MQVESLQELADRSASCEWLFNDLLSESTRMRHGQKSGLFKLGPRGYLPQMVAEFENFF